MRETNHSITALGGTFRTVMEFPINCLTQATASSTDLKCRKTKNEELVQTHIFFRRLSCKFQSIYSHKNVAEMSRINSRGPGGGRTEMCKSRHPLCMWTYLFSWCMSCPCRLRKFYSNPTWRILSRKPSKLFRTILVAIGIVVLRRPIQYDMQTTYAQTPLTSCTPAPAEAHHCYKYFG